MQCPRCESEKYGEQTVTSTTLDGESYDVTIRVCDHCNYQDIIDGSLAPKKDHINPSHYQAFFRDELMLDGFEEPEIRELQWLEAQCRQGRYLKNPNEFVAAVQMQVEKYLDRCGGKDEELQEHLKGLWYHKFMVAFIKNGKKPILVKDIDNILKG